MTTSGGGDVAADDVAQRRRGSNAQVAANAAAAGAKASLDRAVLRRMLGLARPYWRLLAVGAVCLVAASGLGLVLPTLAGDLIDGVGGGDGPELRRIGGVLVVVFIAQAAFGIAQGYLLTYAGERLVADLRRGLYRHLQGLSLGFFDGRRVGDLVSRLTNDATTIRGALTTNLLRFLEQTITLVGAIALVLAINWRLVAVVLVVVPPLVGVGVLFGNRLQKLTTREQEALGEATTVLEETLSGVRSVKAFAREGYEIGRYEGSVGRGFGFALERARLNAAFGPTVTGLGYLSLTGVLVFGAREVANDRLSAGELVSSLLYLVLAVGSLGGLTGGYAQLRQASGAAVRLFELLDTAPEVADAPDARPLPTAVRGDIAFEGVGFRYGREAEAPWVFDGFSLAIAPGETVALVGPSGAGKTTLVNLLLRFYDPEHGRVLLDGHDLRRLTARSLREAIGVVPQEPILFGGTIAENIAYGRLGATPLEIEAAARAANAHAFVAELPAGYDTAVGERGVKLSGGQRQRIAIARAVLKDPAVLLLDEATSSLDNASEAAIQAALAGLMANRTTLVIAHRLSTVERADRIVVLDRGTIVEQGRHAELLARGGLYYRLATRDFAEL